MQFSIWEHSLIYFATVPSELPLTIHLPVLQRPFIYPILCFYLCVWVCFCIFLKLAFIFGIIDLESAFAPHIAHFKIAFICHSIIPGESSCAGLIAFIKISFIFVAILKRLNSPSMRLCIFPISFINYITFAMPEDPFAIYFWVAELPTIVTPIWIY